MSAADDRQDADTREPATTFLVLGGAGMLGTAWLNLLTSHALFYLAPDETELDITDPAALASFVDSTPFDAIVNCAAYTDVDGAESNADVANLINGQAVANLASLCADRGLPLIHYSTDYVFDGQGTTPYATDHPRQALNCYGQSKAIGEEAFENSGASGLLIRTSWLYAPWGKNFVRTIANAAAQRDELRVVDDQRGRPTSAQHLAASSLKLLQAGANGVFHVCDQGECTWFDFAGEIVKLAGADCRVLPCGSDEYPTPAARPTYSVLDLTRAIDTIGAMPTWQDELARVMSEMTDD